VRVEADDQSKNTPAFGRPTMNMRRKLALAAGTLFAASYFMPAMDTSSGFACLDDCWRIFIRSDSSHTLPFGAWLYYSGFVAANALFVVLLGAVLVLDARSRVRSWLAAVSLLQVFSWLIVVLVEMGHGEDLAVRAGYFLWLASFVLLFLAHAIRDGNVNPPTALKP
jgi:hypothetical protein